MQNTWSASILHQMVLLSAQIYAYNVNPTGIYSLYSLYLLTNFTHFAHCLLGS